jgi:hypothetical protein
VSSITTPLVIDQSYSVVGNILSADPVWVNNQKSFLAGYYRAAYLTGAFRANQNQGWIVGPTWFVVSVVNGAVVDLLACPSVSTPQGTSIPTGLYHGQGYDTQGAAQTAFSAAAPITFYHNGGPLGIVLNDNPYSDNVHGSPDPTWQISSLKPAPTNAPTGCVNLTLYNSGTNASGIIAGGTPDTSWSIVPNSTIQTTAVYVLKDPISPSYPVNNSISKWLGPKSSGQYTSITGTYIYRYQIDLSAYDPTTVRLSGRYSADDVGSDILVNGVSTGQKSPTQYTFANFSLSSNFVQGINNVDFVCQNTPSYPSVTAFRVEWTGGVACPPAVVVTPPNPTAGTTPVISTSPTSPTSPTTPPSSTPQSTTPGTETCVKETPTTGLLSAKYKAVLDNLSSHPGGFGFIFKPGTYITKEYGVESILTGDIEFVSQSLSITQSTVTVNGSVQNVFKFAVSPNFFSTFCIQVPGIKGAKGDVGDQGPAGLDGVGVDGPQGDTGPDGVDALNPGTFTGVKFVDLTDISSTAVVSMSLDTDNSILEVVKAPIAVPDNDAPAQMVAATPIYRDVEFSSNNSMTDWTLFAPTTDAVVALTGSPDIDIIKLPDGWNGSEAGVVTQKLSKLVTLVVGYYADIATTVITGWDRQIKEYLASQDAAARSIIADLAMELTECEWSAPLEFAVDIGPVTPAAVPAPAASAPVEAAAPISTPAIQYSYDSGNVSNSHGSGDRFVYYSPVAILNVTGGDHITFNGGCDDIAVMLPPAATIQADGSLMDSSGQITVLTMPVKFKLFNVTDGNTNEEIRIGVTGAAIAATIPANSQPVDATTLLVAAQFPMITWGTPVLISSLAAYGLVDVYGNLTFRLAICPSSGFGRVHVDSVALS